MSWEALWEDGARGREITKGKKTSLQDDSLHRGAEMVKKEKRERLSLHDSGSLSVIGYAATGSASVPNLAIHKGKITGKQKLLYSQSQLVASELARTKKPSVTKRSRSTSKSRLADKEKSVVPTVNSGEKQEKLNKKKLGMEKKGGRGQRMFSPNLVESSLKLRGQEVSVEEDYDGDVDVRENGKTINQHHDEGEGNRMEDTLSSVLTMLRARKQMKSRKTAVSDREAHRAQLGELVQRMSREREEAERDKWEEMESRCVNDDESDEADVVEEDEEEIRLAAGSMFYPHDRRYLLNATSHATPRPPSSETRVNYVVALCPRCSRVYDLNEGHEPNAVEREATSLKTVYEDGQPVTMMAEPDALSQDQTKRISEPSLFADGDDEESGDDEGDGGDDDVVEGVMIIDGDDDDDEDEIVVGDQVVRKSSVRPSSSMWQTEDSDVDDFPLSDRRDVGGSGGNSHWRNIDRDTDSDDDVDQNVGKISRTVKTQDTSKSSNSHLHRQQIEMRRGRISWTEH